MAIWWCGTSALREVSQNPPVTALAWEGQAKLAGVVSNSYKSGIYNYHLYSY